MSLFIIILIWYVIIFYVITFCVFVWLEARNPEVITFDDYMHMGIFWLTSPIWVFVYGPVILITYTPGFLITTLAKFINTYCKRKKQDG